MKRLSWFALFVLLPGAGWSAALAQDCPFKDPCLATVIGTPSEFQPKLPEEIDDKMLSFKVFPERAVPEVTSFMNSVPQRYFLSDN